MGSTRKDHCDRGPDVCLQSWRSFVTSHGARGVPAQPAQGCFSARECFSAGGWENPDPWNEVAPVMVKYFQHRDQQQNEKRSPGQSRRPWKSRDAYPGWGKSSSELPTTAQAPQILTVRANFTPVVIQDIRVRLLLLISLWWYFSSSPYCSGAAGEGSSWEVRSQSGVGTKTWGQGGHGWHCPESSLLSACHKSAPKQTSRAAINLLKA